VGFVSCEVSEVQFQSWGKWWYDGSGLQKLWLFG